MKKTCSILWLSCLSFLVAILVGVFGVGCEGSGGGGGGGNGGGGDITFAQYDAIQAHMSYNDVLGIMGRNPTESMNNGPAIVYTWRASDWESGDPQFILVGIAYLNGVANGVYQKNCSIYDSNHTLVQRNQNYL